MKKILVVLVLGAALAGCQTTSENKQNDVASKANVQTLKISDVKGFKGYGFEHRPFWCPKGRHCGITVDKDGTGLGIGNNNDNTRFPYPTTWELAKGSSGATHIKWKTPPQWSNSSQTHLYFPGSNN